VSLSNRYSKYPYWNVLLESELLQGLVSAETTEDIDINHHLEPLIETPSWSLSILPEIEKNMTRNFQSVPVMNRLNKRLRKNKLKLKEQKSLKGKIFNRKEDWDSLMLVQRMLAKEEPVRKPPVDSESEVQSDDDLTFDAISTEDILPQLTPEPILIRSQKRPSKLTQEIRHKISLVKLKEKAKCEALDELRKFRKPPKGVVRSKSTLLEAFTISGELAEFVTSPLHVPEVAVQGPDLCAPYTLRNRSEVRRKPIHMHHAGRKKTKKTVHWYQMDPFDDPVLERKRLKCLSQKIWDDKKRYELEILRAENEELKEENESLKTKILRLEAIRRLSSESESEDSQQDVTTIVIQVIVSIMSEYHQLISKVLSSPVKLKTTCGGFSCVGA